MSTPLLDPITILCQIDALIQNYLDLKKEATTQSYYIYYGGAIDALNEIRNKITGNHQSF